ncbi:hypothetical protein M9H77_31315 [Catharanthus roseus]|uniref:Uncharacterized protein n=1 Tax=Catharanthus roseus TaxID=4058 RepID=A0ACC0A400_CATRO|nr:hypothetical protein M9H77_31315 [Catharanthus roseus]
MASMKETNNISESAKLGQSFPAVDINKELNPSQNKSFQLDPVSSQISIKTKAKDEERQGDNEDNSSEEASGFSVPNVIPN